MKKKQVAECLSRYTSKWRRKKHSPRKGETQGLPQSLNFLRIANIAPPSPHLDRTVKSNRIGMMVKQRLASYAKR